MADSRPVDFPADAIRDLLEWVRSTNSRVVIIGGIAASILGNPRFTKDVDATVLVDESRLEEFIGAGAAFGFVARVPDAVEFARRARIILVQHLPTRLTADVALAGLGFEVDMVMGARIYTFDGLEIPLPSAEELLVMKALAQRPQDYADIAAVMDANPELDVDAVRAALKGVVDVSEDDRPLVAFEEFLRIRKP